MNACHYPCIRDQKPLVTNWYDGRTVKDCSFCHCLSIYWVAGDEEGDGDGFYVVVAGLVKSGYKNPDGENQVCLGFPCCSFWSGEVLDQKGEHCILP